MDETGMIPPALPAERSPWTWRDVLIIVLAAGTMLISGFIAIAVALVISGGRNANREVSTPALSLSAGALEAIALIGSVYLLGLKRRHLGWDALGLRPVSMQWILFAIVAGLFAIPLSSVIAVSVQQLLGQPIQNPQEAFLLPNGLDPISALLMLFFVGIAGPFAEEILFRGVLYNWLRGHWGFIPSALVSSLIFGAAHVEPSIAIATFVLGLVIVFFYEKSHSLWTAFTIHAVNNTTVVLLLYITLAMGGKP